MMVNHSNIQALLRQGIAAVKAGQTEQASQVLLQVVTLDETNVQAWLWLSTVIDDPEDKFTCLQNVLFGIFLYRRRGVRCDSSVFYVS